MHRPFGREVPPVMALHIGSSGPTGPLWTFWATDPGALLALMGIGMAALLYGRGIARLGIRRPLHPRWRPLVFYLGLAVAFLALVFPLDALTDDAFLWHMTQHLRQLSRTELAGSAGTVRQCRQSNAGPLIRRFVRHGQFWVHERQPPLDVTTGTAGA